MEKITKCARRVGGGNPNWDLQGAQTHRVTAGGGYTRCGDKIQGYDEGWVPPVHRNLTCPTCEVATAYEEAGFVEASTGGGCEAFEARDPHWKAPEKIIHLPVDNRSPRPIRVTAGSTDIITITWGQMLALEERIRSIRDHVEEPRVLVTASEDPSLPETMDEAVDVGYYDTDDQSVWLVTLPNSHAVLRAFREARAKELSLDTALLQEAGATIQRFNE